MTSTIKQYTRALTIGIFLVLFGGYFVLNRADFRPLLDVNVLYLLLIALGTIAIMASNGMFIKFVLEPFGKTISHVESFYISLLSSVGNFFAPVGGGFGVRAVYLKRKYGLSYSDYMSTLYGNYIIVMLVNSFFGLSALYLLRDKQNSQYWVLVLLFAGIFGTSLFLSLIKLPAIPANLRNKYVRYIWKNLLLMTEGWTRIITNRRLFWRLVAIITANFVLTNIVVRLEVGALGFSMSLPALLLFSVLNGLSLFVDITPANLGVKEAIYIFSSSLFGFSVSDILLITLIDRAVLFFTMLILWLFLQRSKKVHNLKAAYLKNGE